MKWRRLTDERQQQENGKITAVVGELTKKRNKKIEKELDNEEEE